MFIDQLAMIQEKTRGNLSNEEATVLRNALSNLQMTFVEVSQSQTGGAAPPPTPATGSSAESSVAPEVGAPEPAGPSGEASPAPPPGAPTSGSEGESKKKFTKSYGS
jgi:hypothetical protein